MSLTCHIGFPKTGSTYLQECVFPQLKDIHYISWNEELLNTFYKIIHYDDSYYDAAKCMKVIRENSLNKHNLFSYEPLTGYHHHSRFSNRTQIAKRLKELGVMKIIITIRNQIEVLNSSYKQYVKNGGVMKIDGYLGLRPKKEHSMLDKSYFDYYSIYKMYTKIFGDNNVLLLQYENMKSPTYLSELNSFVGNTTIGEIKSDKVNASLSVSNTNLLRLINHCTYSVHRPSQLITKKISTSRFFNILKRLPNQGSKSYLTKKRLELVEDYFKESNQQLKSEYKIDLHPTYPV